MPGITVSNDVLEIHKAAGEAVERARSGKGPSLLEVQSERWHGHFVGDAQKYRDENDVKAAQQNDCIANFERMLFEENVLSKTTAGKIQSAILNQIDNAVAFARESPFPEPSELMDDLYV